jgi:hypothetical protein
MKSGGCAAAAAFTRRPSASRHHPAVCHRRRAFSPAQLQQRRAKQRLRIASPPVLQNTKQPSAGNKTVKGDLNRPAKASTCGFVALAPSAVGGCSDLSVPVDAGDVTEVGEAVRPDMNWHGAGEAQYVIMTVKLKESAIASPKCMPMRP